MGPMFSSSLAVLAHQGGWDELALVGVPIIVIIVVLAIAKRRVDAQVDAHVDAQFGDQDADRHDVANGSAPPADDR